MGAAVFNELILACGFSAWEGRRAVACRILVDGVGVTLPQESQAKAQANIWLVLVSASSQPKDQINAFTKAINVLQAAMQPEVVEVRMQFADWLLRNGFSLADALEQLAAAADLLLDIEEGSEDEDAGLLLRSLT